MNESSKNEAVYIIHMLECIERVLNYTHAGRESFEHSTLIQDAVIRNLQTMAESSQKLSESTKRSHPDVPWRAISGFRNIIVHDYLGLDLDVIWGVVDKELPILKTALLRIR